ncbi:LPS export ABC transporter periplasmic protein LptC [uncultured Fibrobacter sp.]|jgi:LPS export ABC transporter protein LptC|uniref:LPS export ABC transporter periplasmic protein LptC n=1 Tax=uncultured Fibrobacter sp. TaxID=261512 RepID=UPI00262C57E9|nr:LPS export ABC transporter periplasmic protein LptC [uncultured Fibrobacter sp.]
MIEGLVLASVLFVLCVLLSACEDIEEEKPWLQVERPEMLFTDTTLMDSYDKGVLSWKLKTAYLERWGDKEVVFVRPVLVDIYDSLGERTAFLRADSGRMDLKFTYVYAYGHVYALTPKGASVRSDSLIWNKRDNLVTTESYVRVVSEEGDVLQGQGFVSDAHMDNWRILSNVTGIFQDAARRLKDEDKKEAKEIETRDSVQAASPAPAAPMQTKGVTPSPSAATPNATSSVTPPAVTPKPDSAVEKNEKTLVEKIKKRGERVKAKSRDAK